LITNFQRTWYITLLLCKYKHHTRKWPSDSLLRPFYLWT
jgi:hypothetical protein